MEQMSSIFLSLASTYCKPAGLLLSKASFGKFLNNFICSVKLKNDLTKNKTENYILPSLKEEKGKIKQSAVISVLCCHIEISFLLESESI